jgi:hypothetical protein
MVRSFVFGALFVASCVWFAAATQAASPSGPEVWLVNANLNRMLQAGNCCTPAAPPTCVTPAPVAPCCPTPCIVYRHRHVRCKVCCGCCQPEPIKTVLAVKNPCTGCPVEIPVCIPGCTTGEPTVCCGTGVFHRDTLTYTWSNGFEIKVAFKHTGDVIVTSYGS